MLLPTLLLALAPHSAGELRCVDRALMTADASWEARGTIPVDSALVAAYASGETWEQFFEAARVARAIWVKNWESAVIPADALAQARTLPAGFRLLVIAIDACSDSVNTIPYLAKLVAEVPTLGMRIIKPAVAGPLMRARPTPDGRGATPTVILLNAEGEEVGCWIERPSALQTMAIEARAGGGMGSFLATKRDWYESDAGASTVREVVALLSAAASGKRGCDASVAVRGQ